ncbi:mycolipanoate synthase [Paramisgurnus dabryanus]|uniref:mycolipanoate synthase n=1 Tax=Paramisgurnus dabryanus TaxID=90735 RepID=UPI003CCF1BFE
MDEDIAVIGIGCNFPGGEGVDNFWKVLVEGRNCVVEIPDERFNKSEWFHPDENQPGKTQTTESALIEGFNEFDHKFFGINEAEANYMDPQQKLLLQCAYRALEDAGMPLEKVSGTRTGVYIGLMNRDYETLLNNSPSSITHYNGTGTAMSIAANRISYTFNLTGPSFAIDSACSSSLVALHLACQAIRQGDCDMALCGGVSCIIEPRVFVALSKAKMISPEGTSKPFCRTANGYGRGEGCGVVLLKPLKKALEDFDHIWGIVSKTAVNQDGRTVTPITKPSMSQQEALLSTVYSSENYLANVQYVEAHGTGTLVGDPVEAGGISKIIAKARPSSSGPLYIGSVKSNIGHTESAAGVAGLIKILLMMKHETIVPSVFYSADNSSIDTEALNLKIPNRAEKWPYSGSRIRTAGLNSFGFGGTNAHAIIQEYVAVKAPDMQTLQSSKLLPLSAATEKSLKMCIADTYQNISVDETVDLQALAYTAACRRSHERHKFRKVFAATSLSELKSLLKSSGNKTLAQTKQDLKLAFVFCGNGVTYRGMCKQLLEEEPIFRDKVKEVENYLKKFRCTSILQKITNDYDNEDFSKPNVVQPLLFAIQVAIAHLLKHWGIKPDIVLGHSVGEVAAAHCSGLLSLQDAVKVIYYRSALQSKVMGGKMLVIGNIAITDVLKVLPAYTGKICLAAVNSPMSCVLSGDKEAVDHVHHKIQSSFKNKNLFLRVLDVPAAYHSHMMDPVLGQIKDSIGNLTQNQMVCELVSTVTGEICHKGDFITGEYWARNIRKPVAFEQAIKAVSNNRANVVFVEIGPRRALQRNIMEILGNDTTVLPTAQPDKDHETILTTVSKLFEVGVNVNWNQFYKGFETKPMYIPRYQFECLKNEVFFEDVRRGNEIISHCPHPLIRPSIHDNKVVKCNLSPSTTSYLWEHKNNGIAIAPGALYVELAFASVMETAVPKMPLSSLQLSINFQSLFVLSKSCPSLTVTLETTTDKTSFQIQSTNTVHASGDIIHVRGPAMIEHRTIHLNTVLKRCPLVIQSNDVYKTLNEVGFEYGPNFKQLGDIRYGQEFKEAITSIRIPEELLNHLYEYFLHPVVLDLFLQMSSVLTSTIRPGFPSAIGGMVISAPPQKEMFMYIRQTKDMSDYLEVCGCFTDKDGHVLIELKGVRIHFLENHAHIRESCFFHNQRIAVDTESSFSPRIKALVFEDTLGIARGLKPCLHPESVFVPPPDLTERSGLDVPTLQSLLSMLDADLNEVLFIWGVQSVSRHRTQDILDSLSDNCELYRQVVLSMRRYRHACSIRVITYRSAEGTADKINPGFVFSGMTRACAAELSDISFQLIDLSSVSREDIESLAHVLYSYKSFECPEVLIVKGKVYSNMITRTPITTVSKAEVELKPLQFQEFTLQIANPYKVTGLSALPSDASVGAVESKSVEVQLNKICVHSSDYFPVSTSELHFGQTMYWNKYSTHNHSLLALDFSGTITAVGKDVSKLKVGDHVICCYPVKATSKVVLPEAVCFKVKSLPFLKDVPCVSYIVLIWEILQCALPKSKQQQKLGILSTVCDSALVKLLMLIANKSGWTVFTETELSELSHNVKQCHLLVILPPYDLSHLSEIFSVAKSNNIVVVCDHRQTLCSSLDVIHRDSETTCLQTLRMSTIFQKSRLKMHGALIQKWLSGMHLQRAWLSIQTSTFQEESSESMFPESTEHSGSYFSAQTLDLIALGSDDATNKISAIRLLPRPKQMFSNVGVYIVSGGLSGLGFETVKFIAQRGGGCIVTLSRSVASEKIQENINALQRRYEVRILNLQCDVSVLEHVMEAITVIGQHFSSCPIRGVFHSAAVLHDGLLESLDRSLFHKVLQPKVCGALNLHHATLHSPKLDYFVCYSSISSFIGNAAQANYAAANSFLDNFCHYRHNIGLAGQSINWGPLKLGLLMNKENFQQFLETKGLITMDVSEIHNALEQCLLTNNIQQVICKFSFRNLKNHVLSQNASLNFRLSALVEEGLKNEALEDSRVDVRSSAIDSIRRILAEICGVDTDDVRDETALMTLGMDSMLAMTMQNRLFQDIGVNIPLVAILDPTSTLSSLTALIKPSNVEDGDVDVLL